MKPTRVRGGPIELLRYASSSGGAKRIDSVVSKFAGETLRDAASAVGARSTWPTFGPRSAITAAAEMLFTQFADTADGAWPLTEQQQRMWDELVSGCLAEHVAIDREELGLWLADSGWEQDAVASIVDRFFADSEWLARRLEVAAT